MSIITKPFYRLLILSIVLIFHTSRSFKCNLNKFENCNQNINNAIKLNFTIKTVNAKQYVDGTMTLDKNLDDTIWFNTTVKRLTNGVYLYLFSFEENKGCTALNKYLGESLYDLERLGQMIPGMCPLQKGKYHWHNAQFSLKKVPTLASFPFGTLQLTTNFYEADNHLYGCAMGEIEFSM